MNSCIQRPWICESTQIECRLEFVKRTGSCNELKYSIKQVMQRLVDKLQVLFETKIEIQDTISAQKSKGDWNIMLTEEIHFASCFFTLMVPLNIFYSSVKLTGQSTIETYFLFCKIKCWRVKGRRSYCIPKYPFKTHEPNSAFQQKGNSWEKETHRN